MRQARREVLKAFCAPCELHPCQEQSSVWRAPYEYPEHELEHPRQHYVLDTTRTPVELRRSPAPRGQASEESVTVHPVVEFHRKLAERLILAGKEHAHRRQDRFFRIQELVPRGGRCSRGMLVAGHWNPGCVAPGVVLL